MHFPYFGSILKWRLGTRTEMWHPFSWILLEYSKSKFVSLQRNSLVPDRLKAALHTKSSYLSNNRYDYYGEINEIFNGWLISYRPSVKIRLKGKEILCIRSWTVARCPCSIVKGTVCCEVMCFHDQVVNGKQSDYVMKHVG